MIHCGTRPHQHVLESLSPLFGERGGAHSLEFTRKLTYRATRLLRRSCCRPPVSVFFETNTPPSCWWASAGWHGTLQSPLRRLRHGSH
eukprot:scaffold3323_cov279-Pinguiococcus_pyrenoidosus.AAC.17